MLDLFGDATSPPESPPKAKQAELVDLAAMPQWVDTEAVVFDIETGPGDEDLIRSIVPPYDPSSIGESPGEFDPSTVKLGRMKDQAKIDKKIEEDRQSHYEAVAKWNAKAATAESDYWRVVLDKAALSPITGQILAIGYGQHGRGELIAEGDERSIIESFWESFEDNPLQPLVGWNIAGFDVWFLVNRSRILGIPHPAVMERGGRYLDSRRFVDLMDHWNCGSRSFYDPMAGKNKTGAKAKEIARLLGVGRPADATPVTHGGQFAEYWNGTPEQREQARDYLRWDIREEMAIGRVFGVL